MSHGEFVFLTLAAGLTLASVAVYVLKWIEEPHRSEDEPLPPDDKARAGRKVGVDQPQPNVPTIRRCDNLQPGHRQRRLQACFQRGDGFGLR